MKLDRFQIETMRGVMREYWLKAGHSHEAPDALCDLALSALSENAPREKLLAKAVDAAFAFIDSHAADPDLTSEMCIRHAEYLEARRALEGTP